jgi:methylthioxylose transferase
VDQSVLEPIPDDRTPEPEGRRPVRPWLILAGWAGVILAARLVLQDLKAGGAHLRIPFPPLDAALDWRPGWRLVWSVGVGIVAVVWAPRVARTCSWRALLAGSTFLGAGWAIALALLDGSQGLVGSVALKNEYFLDVGRVGSPVAFLGGFVDHIAEYRIHVQGHPPGYLLVLWALDRLGLGSVSAVAAVEIAVGVLAIPAVLLAVREVAGTRAARAAAPFLAVAPIAIWVATSADAFYAGVGAWAVALLVLATGRRDRRGFVDALAGGVLFGVTAFLSYGLVLLAVIPVAVAIVRRRCRPLVVAGAGALAVFALFAAAGFWWFDGLAATRTQYFAGVASRRPYLEFLLVNLACFAIALGPAIAVALVRLRDRRLWLLVGAALLAVAVAGLSGMSKGEVERIWLPFAVWVLPAGAALGLGCGRSGLRSSQWLALQVVFTIGLSTLVRSPW